MPCLGVGGVHRRWSVTYPWPTVAGAKLCFLVDLSMRLCGGPGEQPHLEHPWRRVTCEPPHERGCVGTPHGRALCVWPGSADSTSACAQPSPEGAGRARSAFVLTMSLFLRDEHGEHEAGGFPATKP